MSGQVIRKIQAKHDLASLSSFIALNNRRSAERFLAAAEKAFASLAAMPGMGAPWESANPRLADLRFWSIRGFENHLIFYRPVDGGIEVIRVLHGSRDIESILESGAN